MYSKILHQHSSMANCTVSWFSTDSNDTYLKNMTNSGQRSIIERNGWNESNVTYSFNSHGFRADEFDDNDSIMFLGCSITLGTGLSVEHTWPHLVSKKLGLKNYNLGISGGSNDSAFRLANHYISQIKPKIVVFMATSESRFDIITDSEVYTLMYNRVPLRFDGEWYKDWITYKENGNLNWKKNYYAIKYLCDLHNVQLVYSTPTNHITWPNKDNARDIIHPGKECNQAITDGILALI